MLKDNFEEKISINLFSIKNFSEIRQKLKEELI